MRIGLSFSRSNRQAGAFIAFAVTVAGTAPVAYAQTIQPRASIRQHTIHQTSRPIRNPVVRTGMPRIGTAVVVGPPDAFYWSRSFWPWYRTTSSAPFWHVTTYGGPPLQERARRLDPCAAPAPASTVPPPPPVPLDEGREALRAGDFARAIAIYERRVREQHEIEQGTSGTPLPDRAAMRLLGLALIGADRMPEAIEAWSRAETEEPGISLRPLDGASLLGSRAEVRSLTVRAVRFAQANPTRAAWDAVAVLMEAEGRMDHARRMRERGAQLEKPNPPLPRPATPSVPAAPPRPANFSMPPPLSR